MEKEHDFLAGHSSVANHSPGFSSSRLLTEHAT